MSASPRVLVAFGGIPLHGQERANIQVLRALRDQGADVLFVTERNYGHESIQPELDRLGFKWTRGTYPLRWSRGMSIRDVGRQIRDMIRANTDFVRAAREFRPTHIHMVSERFLADLLPAVWWLRKPVVFRLGDLPRQHRSLFRALWRWVYIPTVTQFVGNAGFVESALLEAGVPARKLRRIYSVAPERALDAPSDLDADLLAEANGEAPYAGRTVVYMGQLNEEKGVHQLVEAAIALCQDRDDVRFLIAGDYAWENPFAQNLIASVETAGLKERIRFLGYTKDVPRLLSIADIHVAPSVYEEPLANTVLEAKRAGVPSVVFPSGGLPEVVVESGRDAVLCREKTPEALAEGLTHYLDLNADALADAGRAAQESLATLGITPEVFAREWANVYATT